MFPTRHVPTILGLEQLTQGFLQHPIMHVFTTLQWKSLLQSRWVFFENALQCVKLMCKWHLALIKLNYYWQDDPGDGNWVLLFFLDNYSTLYFYYKSLCLGPNPNQWQWKKWSMSDIRYELRHSRKISEKNKYTKIVKVSFMVYSTLFVIISKGH